MANGFVRNATRYIPYPTQKFTVEINGVVVMGCSKVSAVMRKTTPISFKAGGDPNTHKTPGRTEYDAVTIEHGLTHDPAFANWGAQVSNPLGDSLMDLNGFRKNVTINFRNERGQTALRFFLIDAWPSEWTAMPELDANGNAIAIESMKLEFEYFTIENVEPDQSA
jgi:phage tail-like protein